MSGVKNLANAVANEPGFMKQVTGFTKQELNMFVPQGDVKTMTVKTPNVKSGAKGMA